MNAPLTVGSLFSGIGGFDLGFERAGMRVLWQCEQDEFCRRVLAKHWPDVPCYPDVCDLGVGVHPPHVDLLCGGFPCQDLSVAGRGAGLDGARSGLYAEVMRLIGVLRPKYVVLENVPAIRSRGLGRVLGEMAALGYDAEWDCIPASAVGAHHQRDRWWLVAYPQRFELREQSRRGGWTHGSSASFAPVDGTSRSLADAPRDAEGGVRTSAGAERQRAGTSSAPGGARTGGDGTGELANAEPARLEGHGAVSGQSEVSQSRDSGAPLAESHRVTQLQQDDAEGTFSRQLAREGAGRRGERGRGGEGEAPGPFESRLGRVADGVPRGLDGRWIEPRIPRVGPLPPNGNLRLKACGNALVPEIARRIGVSIVEFESAHYFDLEEAAA